MKKEFWVITIACLFLIFFLAYKENIFYEQIFANIKVGQVLFNVEIADTEALRMKGIGGRENLEQGKGMLFIFSNLGIHGFWMKDTLIPLDIIWFDKENNISLIEKNVSPNSYPKIFNSDIEGIYVLEIGGGESDRLHLKIGDRLTLKSVVD